MPATSWRKLLAEPGEDGHIVQLYEDDDFYGEAISHFAAEGLVRWTHPTLGPIPPDDFIALAEETGNIRRLTRWALATGIAQASRWSRHPIRVSINVSVLQLLRG